MYRALWDRVASFRSACLLLIMMTLILQGCATELLSKKLEGAEQKLSHGRPAEDDLKKETAPLLPPSVAARYKLALVMDAYLKGESGLAASQEHLKRIRDNALTPWDQQVEAGYLTVLMEKLEGLQKSLNSQTAKSREFSKENDELKKVLDQVKREYEELKKESDLLSYKLKKLEEIHIQTEKRRGTK